MSVFDQTIASVEQLLEQVRKLWIEKRRVELQNRVRGTYLQCLIFRKFALIDAILEVSPEARNAMGKIVGLKRKQVKADAGDLERMRVPKLLEVKTVEKWSGCGLREPFPYLNLLPEIRRAILGYLTAPLDKLSLAETVPEDGEMMGWKANVLKFEMVLPKLLDSTIVPDKKRLDYDDVVKLCHASPQLYDVVKKYFESFVSPNHRDYFFYNRYCKQGTPVNPTEFTLNPLPTVFSMEFDAEETSVAQRNQQLQILRQIGKNIWSASISINEMSSLEAMLIIQECLELLPNLKILSVYVFLQRNGQENADFLENIELPQLEHLRRLDLKGSNSGIVDRKLLERYRCVIIHLQTAEFISLVTRESAGYPGLTGLKARAGPLSKKSMRRVLSRLEKFGGSPLKSIFLDLEHISINAETFRDLMLGLSKFGTTLEDLSVHFMCWKENDTTTPDLSWLASVDFPKVKTLSIQGYRENWAILLCFPALETLFWGEYHWTNARNYYEGVYILDLPEILGGEDVEEATIWKMCPFLNKICIIGHSYDMYEKCHDNLTVWRSQSIKLDGINRDFGPPDITVKGSMMGDVFQSTDTVLVIRGDVFGEIVQTGNGRIQVGGIVEGDIWQDGDGKIFVRKEHRGSLIQRGSGTADIQWDRREDN